MSIANNGKTTLPPATTQNTPTQQNAGGKRVKGIAQLATFSPIQGAGKATVSTPATTHFALKQTPATSVFQTTQAQNQDQIFTTAQNKKTPRILSGTPTNAIGGNLRSFAGQAGASSGKVIQNAPNKSALALKGASPANAPKSAAAASYAYRVTK